MELPTLNISAEELRKVLTDVINEFIRIEKTETGLAYQQKSYFIRGQLSVTTALIQEQWDFSETGQSYYDFLKYLVEKYNLSGVWSINDLWELKKS